MDQLPSILEEVDFLESFLLGFRPIFGVVDLLGDLDGESVSRLLLLGHVAALIPSTII